MVPNAVISLKEAVRKLSNLGGQGYVSYNCKQQCKTSKCKCKVAGKLCTS